ncbi:MAG: hypothetical protein HON23_06390 [Rickettsiales bacterium]|nr:hypothetical protein [Rickettsiales bacterium]
MGRSNRLCRNIITKPSPIKRCIIIKYSFRIALAISAKAFHKIQTLYQKTLSQLYCNTACKAAHALRYAEDLPLGQILIPTHNDGIWYYVSLPESDFVRLRLPLKGEVKNKDIASPLRGSRRKLCLIRKGVKQMLAALFLLSLNSYAELTGYAAIDNRFFFDHPQFDGQESNNGPSFVIEPEYYHVSEAGNDVLTFKAFARYDQYDSHRSHIDIRGLDWVHSGDSYEMKIGISKVYWGVTESNHLVDVINQIDSLEDSDGEDKFGQSMVQYARFSDFGTLRFFYLPFFREQEFASEEGRLRSGVLVSNDLAIYDNPEGENYPSFAVRYQHSIGYWDIGLAHFSGISREARFKSSADSNGNNIFVPIYDIIEQSSIDLQLTMEGWLWKLEAIERSGQGDRFAATTFGTEYTFYGFNEAGYDLGVLLEYTSDGRGITAPTVLADNDIFMGARLTFNDISDSAALVGIFFDYETEAKLISLEASTRYGNNWKIELDLRFYEDSRPNTFEANIKDDSHIQLRLARYF